jgi:hypothetical protein
MKSSIVVVTCALCFFIMKLSNNHSNYCGNKKMGCVDDPVLQKKINSNLKKMFQIYVCLDQISTFYFLKLQTKSMMQPSEVAPKLYWISKFCNLGIFLFVYMASIELRNIVF